MHDLINNAHTMQCALWKSLKVLHRPAILLYCLNHHVDMQVLANGITVMEDADPVPQETAWKAAPAEGEQLDNDDGPSDHEVEYQPKEAALPQPPGMGSAKARCCIASFS